MEEVFFLKYLISSQPAIMWMCALFGLATLAYWGGLLGRSAFALKTGTSLTWAAVALGWTGLMDLGGALGLAVINEVLNDRTDLHISRLQDRVTWGNTTAVETLNMLTQRMQGMGDSAIMAMKQLSQIVHRQAAVMGYGDAFLMLSLFYVALSVLVLFVNKPPSLTTGGGDAH